MFLLNTLWMCLKGISKELRTGYRFLLIHCWRVRMFKPATPFPQSIIDCISPMTYRITIPLILSIHRKLERARSSNFMFVPALPFNHIFIMCLDLKHLKHRTIPEPQIHSPLLHKKPMWRIQLQTELIENPSFDLLHNLILCEKTLDNSDWNQIDRRRNIFKNTMG